VVVTLLLSESPEDYPQPKEILILIVLNFLFHAVPVLSMETRTALKSPIKIIFRVVVQK